MIALDGRTLTLEAIVAVADGAPVRSTPRRARAVARPAPSSIAPRPATAPSTASTPASARSRRRRIAAADLDALQMNLVRSHAAGVGEPLPVRAVRASMALRANVLAKGYSGIRVETLEALLALLNAGVHPVVPSRGSVGASGDLAPLAHLALALIGEGDVLGRHGRGAPAARRCARPASTPLGSAAKEGLALINGTQASTAVLALAVAAAARLARAADIVAALTIDALRGSITRSTRAFTTPARTPASGYRPPTCAGCVEGSPLNHSHANCGRVQDAYSMRCMPAGARRGPRRCSPTSAASSRSRPTPPPTTRWSSPTTARCVSGGNFHGAPVALAADLLAIARRPAGDNQRAALRAAGQSGAQRAAGVPDPRGGLDSGLMLAQVTAAALTSELKTLAHPASVDTIPTSADQEDHVSMSMHAALKAERAVALATHVLAVELRVRLPGDRSAGAAGLVGAADAGRTRASAPRCRGSTPIVRRRRISKRRGLSSPAAASSTRAAWLSTDFAAPRFEIRIDIASPPA